MVVADGWTGMQAALAHAPWRMIQRFAFDLVAIVLLTGGIYYRHHRRTDLFLTIVSGNVTVFVITLLLSQSEMSIGAAFGLFAVFSMLRFRTESLSAREMSYLFLSIALGLAMAIAPLGGLGLATLVLLLLGSTELLEGEWLVAREHTQPVLYDNIGLIRAGSQAELIADLRTRTGMDVRRVEVIEIDLLRDSARLSVIYAPRR